MKFKSLLFSVTALLFLVTACSKEEEEYEPFPKVYSKSLVKSTIVDGHLVYTVIIDLLTQAQLTKATETGPEGNFDRSGEIKVKSIYYNLHLEKEYYEKEPLEGTYLLNIRCADGREKAVSNFITKPFLIPAKNICAVLDKNEGIIMVTWDRVINAGYYQIFYQKYGTETVLKRIIDTREAWIDAADFSMGEPYDIMIGISAFDDKSDSEMAISESSQITFHVDEFIAWGWLLNN